MSHFYIEGNILYWKRNHEVLTVQSWGPDSVRVRSTRLAEFPKMPGGVLA